MFDDNNVEEEEEVVVDDGIMWIYIDGSSFVNGKVGFCVGVGVWFGDGDWCNIVECLFGEL